MPINNITGFPGNQNPRAAEGGAAAQVARDEPTAKQAQTGTPSTVDTVSLTDASAQLQKLEEEVSSLPVVDTQRVEETQRAISEGTFEIDSARIAEKMLGLEQELNG